jgi:hypothetical protein
MMGCFNVSKYLAMREKQYMWIWLESVPVLSAVLHVCVCACVCVCVCVCVRLLRVEVEGGATRMIPSR